MSQKKPPGLSPLVHPQHFFPPEPSRQQQQNWRPRGGETVYKTAVFLGSMIVVAMLLLVLICMARWENIMRLVPPVFSSESRRWVRRRTRTSRSNSNQFQTQHDLEASSEDHVTMSNSLSKKNRSSNKRAVEALPVVNYLSSNPGKSGCLVGTECSICLCDFSDGDRVRILPDCYHGFHVECVDVWLIAHASCPSCRSSLHTAGFASKQQQPSISLPIPSSSSTMALDSLETTRFI